MSTKKIVGILIAVSFALLALLVLPENTFFGINSHSSESPSPMEIRTKNNEIIGGFEIFPVECMKNSSGLTESHFQITNTHDEDYGVKIGILFTNNDAVLYEKEVDVVIMAGHTINQVHKSDFAYENPVCVVQINDWYET